ncbi:MULTISPECIES: O-antigen ligase family protein [Rhizobium]|uniref:Lipid A core-O-antigen ligase-like enyme n=1 Tax=Rhizobium favelukesii TaxID=348824 RepID=W6RPY8_9HYPH|nr:MULTISPECIES: O-antigen ligase [Rhizobium]MCS0461836.1 O-antigen ligase family protein [Rhizobium favelukesii]UFS79277.1 O-antigen ligase family protein [Rhizobium sp. T136]CDM62809.1 lipid A core-O-antigen ligase-like enyme [Rhizobium favelukesii]
MADIGRTARVRNGGAFAAFLFLAIFSYFWVGLNPFPDPNAASLSTPYGGSSNVLNQLIVIAMSGVVLATILQNPARHLLLRPYGLLICLLAWLLFTGLFAGDPSAAFRRIVFAILVCLCANATLLIPTNGAQFAKLMCIGLTFAIGLSYFGVLVLPHLAVHQVTDALEQSLAGDWRGHFGHKNIAAAAMVYAVFFGLYIAKAGHARLGSLIALSAGFFVLHAGGKTSAAMLPAILLLAWIFERWTRLGMVMLAGGLVSLNLILLSAAVSPSFSSLLASAGIDPTFTDRGSIWRLALSAIAERPIIGYGFQSFWQTDALFNSGQAMTTWAVTAANSHNGYVEQLINGGIPALAMTVTWLVILPIGYARRALAGSNDITLTRLFLRIWLFSLFLACLESPFFGNSGPIWFTMLLAVFGLRLQANAGLVVSAPAAPVLKVDLCSAPPAKAAVSGKAR